MITLKYFKVAFQLLERWRNRSIPNQNMKKIILAITLALGVNTLVHATTCNLFSSVNCNSSYTCSLPTSSWTGQQVTSCTFNFNSCSLTSGGSGYLYCQLIAPNNSTCTVGQNNGPTQSWTCTLNSTGLNYLNNCLTSGTCDFGIGCLGNWNIGNCSVDYTCSPGTKGQSVPDLATTAFLLGLSLTGLELVRRKLVPAAAVVS